MSYVYETEKPKIFTEDGQKRFLDIRDTAQGLLKSSGAFRVQELMQATRGGGDTWFTMACLDRLVELKEIVKLGRDSWAQYQVYTTPQVHNL